MEKKDNFDPLSKKVTQRKKNAFDFLLGCAKILALSLSIYFFFILFFFLSKRVAASYLTKIY